MIALNISFDFFPWRPVASVDVLAIIINLGRAVGTSYYVPDIGFFIFFVIQGPNIELSDFFQLFKVLNEGGFNSFLGDFVLQQSIF